MKKVILNPIFTRDEQGRGYSGYLAEFPELMAQGTTKEDVVRKLMSSLVDILEYRKEQAFFADPITGNRETNPINLTPVF